MCFLYKLPTHLYYWSLIFELGNRKIFCLMLNKQPITPNSHIWFHLNDMIWIVSVNMVTGKVPSNISFLTSLGLHVKLLWQQIPNQPTNRVGKAITKAKPKCIHFCCIMWCDVLVILESEVVYVARMVKMVWNHNIGTSSNTKISLTTTHIHTQTIHPPTHTHPSEICKAD